MISPTVGRVVWFYDENHAEGCQPKAATVAFVHTDRCVNLATFTHDGHAGAYQDVILVQEGDERPETGVPFCAWMPYQQSQSKKHSGEDKELAGLRKELAAQRDELAKLQAHVALQAPVGTSTSSVGAEKLVK